MVRAILEGKKTQTRRVVKPQPLGVDGAGSFSQVYRLGPAYLILGREAEDDDRFWLRGSFDSERSNPYLACPYGAPGDRLWVRETWMCDEYGRRHQSQGMVRYRATDAESMGAWRPSIFMPRWASRITLEIEGVRVGRVQDISDDDALAEGARAPVGPLPRDTFALLWDRINEKRGYSWESNPWVWVVEFRRLP